MPESRFATFFHWRIDSAERQAFVDAWTEMTHALRQLGSHGSALFTRPDGTVCAFARWPDQATRDRAFSEVDDSPAARAMRASTLETIARVDMDLICDLWAGGG